MHFYFRCVLRFPSTNIKISFQSLIEEEELPVNNPPPPPASPPKKKILPPLKISIPDTHHSINNSPCLSPTGTLRYCATSKIVQLPTMLVITNSVSFHSCLDKNGKPYLFLTIALL